MWIGDVQCSIVSAGQLRSPPDVVFPHLDPVTRTSLLGGRLDDGGMFASAQNCVVLQVADRVVLIDTGMGEYGVERGVPAETLAASLRSVGVAPERIDTVILTHGHGDHIGGVSVGGRLAFPGATHLLSEAEYELWTGSQADAFPEWFSQPAREQIARLGDAGLLQLVEGDHEVGPGVRLEPAPGHTPGQVVVTVESRDQLATLVADAVLDPLHVAHPDWVSTVDLDPVEVVATRRALLRAAATDGRLVIGFHVAEPGRVRPGDDDHLQFVPETAGPTT